MDIVKHYLAIRERCQNAILLVRYGDFYEALGPDARIVSQVAGIALTRTATGGEPVPLAGFPCIATNRYVKRLTEAGYLVALYPARSSVSERPGIEYIPPVRRYQLWNGNPKNT